MKNYFLNISIKNKLVIGFGIIVLIMITTGVREILVLDTLNEKRIRTSDAVRVTKLLKEIRFIISSEFFILNEINEARIQKDLDEATGIHINNMNDINSAFDEVISKIKLRNSFKFNIQNRQISDSTIVVARTYRDDIVPMFDEVIKKKDNVINIDNHYIEHLQINTSDSLIHDSSFNFKSKEGLKASLNDELSILNYYIKDNGTTLIRKLINTEQISTQIAEKLEAETLTIFESKSNETSLFVLSVILISVLVSLFISRSIISPLVALREHLYVLTRGELPENIEIKTDDEIGEMGNAINKLVKGLGQTAAFSTDIGKGNFVTDYKPLSKKDVLGNSLLSMRDSLKAAIEEEEKRKIEDAQRNRTSEGLALFGNILRQHTENINKLSDDIISNLVKFMNSNQGGIFILNDLDKDDIYLDLVGAYAYNRKKFIKKQVKLREGLVGAAAVEKYTVYMTEIPNNYIEIESGVGSSNPTSILIVPIKDDSNEVLGVIELASFNEFENYEVNLVEKIAESIASTLATSKINTQTAQLLEQSKEQTVKMREQEEEMLQNIEELRATQDESEKREQELRQTLIKLEKTSKILKSKDINQKLEIEELTKLKNIQIMEIEQKKALSNIILETSINAIIILNKDFEIEIFNNSATRHFGYTKEDAIGKKIFFMLSEDVRKKVEESNDYIKKELITGFMVPEDIRESETEGAYITTRLTTGGKEAIIIAKNKSEVPVFYSMTKFDFSGEDKYSVFLKNISWEKKSEVKRMKLVENIMAKEFEYEVRIDKLENLLERNNIEMTDLTGLNELISWNNNYSINVTVIDKQHKTWINIINKLYSKFKTGSALYDIMQIFNELSDYTDYHFGFEEKYMSEFKYENLAKHKEKHKAFLAQLNKFKKEYKEGKVDVAYNLMGFLRKWVRAHINEDDMSYADLFRESGLT